MRRNESGSIGGRVRSVCRALAAAELASVLFVAAAGRTFGQTPQPFAPPPIAAAPALIYWKQHLFLIPYQWGSAAEPGVARAVWLFVSKDRGASWQKISEAKPDVKAFNYRAEGDGEYWFAVRTFDKMGRSWPQGPYQPELRVVVDTTLPRIDEVRGRLVENGAVEVEARASDANLDANSWRFEWQPDPLSPWQPAVLQKTTNTAIGNGAQSCMLPAPTSQIHGIWQIPPGARPTAFRGIVFDRAGNSSVYQTRIEASPAISGPLLAAPMTNAIAAPSPPAGAPATIAPAATSAVQPVDAPQAWLANQGPPHSAAVAPSGPMRPPAPPAAPQPWPASNPAKSSIQLWNGAAARTDDGVTTFGSPPLFEAPPASVAHTDAPSIETPPEQPRVEARFAAATQPAANATTTPATVASAGPKFLPLEPYRETTSTATAPATPTAMSPPIATTESPAAAKPPGQPITPVDSSAMTHAPTTAPKLVGSRTFALEYDLDDGGRGVTKVELWGTRDGGQTWSRFAQDDDNRSPLIVTVDSDGLYGFRILVQTADGPTAEPPRSGDAPELWVSVDLKRPTVELTAIERGQGNLADHLTLRWRATDSNLESRPISLYYSSHSTGPWSAIATNLENTGEYAWRVERYVPARFYLRIEARDTAGNLAAFQTRDPIEFSLNNMAGRLLSVQPVK